MTSAPLRVDIAGEPWAVTVSERWRSRFAVAFAHLAGEDGVDATVRVSARAQATAEEALWSRALLAGQPDGDAVAAVENQTGRAHVSRMSIESWDRRSGDGESVLLDPALESTYLGTNLLLKHIVWRCAARALVPVHAAAVGDGDGFWLIPAAAGQGKSTLAAAAVAGGLHVLSDDFVVFDPARGRLHSLYATLRLAPGSHRMIARQFGEGSLSILAAREDDKLLLAPGPAVVSGAFRSCGVLRGILLLERTGRVRLGEVVAPARALHAFASTLRLLPSLGYPAALAFGQLRALTTSIAARVLETGPDLTALVHCLRDLGGDGGSADARHSAGGRP